MEQRRIIRKGLIRYNKTWHAVVKRARYKLYPFANVCNLRSIMRSGESSAVADTQGVME